MGIQVLKNVAWLFFSACATNEYLAESQPEGSEARGTIPAFPGAEGFGAYTSGGRGGTVCLVTKLTNSGPGTLQNCLDKTGPRTIVFRVSGVIAGPLYMTHGDVTIAGQTSPSGVTIKGGLICDNVYDPNDCNDVILRHVRLRKGTSDGLRIGGAHDWIVDHVSLANSFDENMEISRSHDITIQNSIIAEPLGEHFRWGGILLNYSADPLVQDRITLHHNLWNGVYGRLPEISCEENEDAPGSNCSGRTLELELTNNLMWDVSDPIWYNRCTGTNEGNDCALNGDNFFVALNWRNNFMVRRNNIDNPMFENAFTDPVQNTIYQSGNKLQRGTTVQSYAMNMPSLQSPHAYPAVTLTSTDGLVSYMKTNAGAFPRDPMDRRLISYLSMPIDSKPKAWSSTSGKNFGDGLSVNPTKPVPTDTDKDGMPDAWETAHTLNPNVSSPSAFTLANRANNGVAGCTAGYTDLECYLNELAVQRLSE